MIVEGLQDFREGGLNPKPPPLGILLILIYMNLIALC